MNKRKSIRGQFTRGNLVNSLRIWIKGVCKIIASHFSPGNLHHYIIQSTIGENNIDAPKMRNNFWCTFKLLNFSNFLMFHLVNGVYLYMIDEFSKDFYYKLT